jgi:hypothetical protein
MSEAPYACPVCRAGFRGQRECSRCGADLHALMVLAAASWRLRGISRAALRQGNFRRAARLAEQAQETCADPRGQALLNIAQFLLADETAA